MNTNHMSGTVLGTGLMVVKEGESPPLWIFRMQWGKGARTLKKCYSVRSAVIREIEKGRSMMTSKGALFKERLRALQAKKEVVQGI